MTDNDRPTTAFVLAAGLGTRMRPLTDTRPKPLVSLAGRPLIDHVLDRLAHAGIEKAVVNVHYRADDLIAHLAHRASPHIEISDERAALLDTGGGVVHALAKLGSAPFLIHNSDTVWLEGMGSNLQSMLRVWDPTRMDSLMLLAPVASSIGYDGLGDFTMASDGRLTRRASAHVAPFVFAGVSIAHPRLFAGAPSGPFSMNRLWDRAADAGRLHGLRLDGVWMHVGTPEALQEAEAAFADARAHSASATGTSP